jgi:hypothetical protein
MREKKSGKVMVESILSFCAAMAFFAFLFYAMPLFALCVTRLERRQARKRAAEHAKAPEHSDFGMTKAA